MIKCGSCDWWANSPIKNRGDRNSATQRKCIAKRSDVSEDSESCRYFKPQYFHCSENNCRLTFDQCLARRRNTKNLLGYQNCRRCRQFDKEIREIVESYYLDLVPIVTPRHLARGENGEKIGSGKILRRPKKDGQSSKGKRKIKRRNKPTNTEKPRKIKRRTRSDNGLKYIRCPACNAEAMRDDLCRVCGFKNKDALERIHDLVQSTKKRRKIKRRK